MKIKNHDDHRTENRKSATISPTLSIAIAIDMGAHLKPVVHELKISTPPMQLKVLAHLREIAEIGKYGGHGLQSQAALTTHIDKARFIASNSVFNAFTKPHLGSARKAASGLELQEKDPDGADKRRTNSKNRVPKHRQMLFMRQQTPPAEHVQYVTRTDGSLRVISEVPETEPSSRQADTVPADLVLDPCQAHVNQELNEDDDDEEDENEISLSDTESEHRSETSEADGDAPEESHTSRSLESGTMPRRNRSSSCDCGSVLRPRGGSSESITSGGATRSTVDGSGLLSPLDKGEDSSEDEDGDEEDLPLRRAATLSKLDLADLQGLRTLFPSSVQDEAAAPQDVESNW
eukprot:CAMPEP_0197622886 /NCGR_PEP_ID=MMETSP1338-20131121/2997_1 /TAXON_ID=43686 ORGANISM="Pelagodinium beii, Strain RCC1491" /NCGR_SAMPLE_ID=MMETSP1338 /ASSEMBLY_ACC=CAM_ASM_000754 /LENGTH=347 /DNA_ID=CAMNT_0043192663 /DNA_START=114 /DNA_END=1154 /DNA_ORIENTATION=-